MIISGGRAYLFVADQCYILDGWQITVPGRIRDTANYHPDNSFCNATVSFQFQDSSPSDEFTFTLIPDESEDKYIGRVKDGKVVSDYLILGQLRYYNGSSF